MTYAVLALGFVIVALLIFVILKASSSRPANSADETLKILNDSFNARFKELSDRFHAQTAELSNTTRFLGTVNENFGRMEEATKRIFDVGKDISGLHDILRAPKLRGNLGEFFLNDILSQYFPKDKYHMPYTFRSGEKVDAALSLADGKIVPIDSKFPLENFRKMIEQNDEGEKKKMRKLFLSDVKKRIDEIARYIVPDEGTMDFALLYIPAENVYYEVIVKDEEDDGVAAYAFKKRVIPVSPNNFFVYLQTILIGLRGMQVEHNARDIQAGLIRLKGDFVRFGECFDVIGTHITNANNKFEEAQRRFDKVSNKFESIENFKEPLKNESTLLE